MSHDRNGTPLQAGDLVSMEFRVKSVSPDADQPNLFCNCDLESVLTMPGNDTHSNLSAVNTRQTLLIQKGE